MKGLVVSFIAVLLVVLFTALAVSAQGELKDLEVKIEAPGVRYPDEWFDVTIKVTNPNRVDTFFYTSVWFDNPDVVGGYIVSWVSPDTRVYARECGVATKGCVFDWAGDIGWEQYKLLTFRVRAGNSLGTQGFIRVRLGQALPLWPTLISADKSITIASPPEESSQPPSVKMPLQPIAPIATAKLYVERRSPLLNSRLVNIHLVLHSEEDTWFTGTISSDCGIKVDFVSPVGQEFHFLWSEDIPDSVQECTFGGPVYAPLLLKKVVTDHLTFTYRVS